MAKATAPRASAPNSRFWRGGHVATEGVVDLRLRQIVGGKPRVKLEGDGFGGSFLRRERFEFARQFTNHRLPSFWGDRFAQGFSRQRVESQPDEEHQDDSQTCAWENAVENEGYQRNQDRFKQILIEDTFEHGVCSQRLHRHRIPGRRLGKWFICR